jgi:hypothetical protein
VKLFPDSGLLGIRLLGVINVSAIIYVVYKLLNKHINNIALYIGLIIVTTSFVGAPTEFFHNNLSSLLFVGATLALYEGLERNKLILFALSGILLALNVFARLPNILDIGIILIIVIHCYYNKEKINTCAKRILILLAGYAVSIICILGAMKLIGHYDIYVRTMSGLKEVAVGNTENTHSLLSMILVNISAYKDVIFNGFFATTLIISLSFILGFFNSNKTGKYIWIPVLITLLVFSFFMGRLPVIDLLYYFSIISLCWNIYSKEIDIKILSWIGLFMLIVMPLGSDWAIRNFGNYSVWIAIPLTVNLFFTEELSIRIKINRPTSAKQFNFQLEYYYIKLALFMFLIVIIGRTQYKVLNTCYFDPGSRFYKTFKINNPRVKYIFTTRERATIVNDLLVGIKPYVKDGDSLIAYESIPMVYYLTNTKPFLHNSWLTGLNKASFSRMVEGIAKGNRPLPIVIRQKFETIGEFSTPSDNYISDDRNSDLYVSQEQTRMFNQFLINNNYKAVWNNDHFVLYRPEI